MIKNYSYIIAKGSTAIFGEPCEKDVIYNIDNGEYTILIDNLSLIVRTGPEVRCIKMNFRKKALIEDYYLITDVTNKNFDIVVNSNFKAVTTDYCDLYVNKDIIKNIIFEADKLNDTSYYIKNIKFFKYSKETYLTSLTDSLLSNIRWFIALTEALRHIHSAEYFENYLDMKYLSDARILVPKSLTSSEELIARLL